MLRFGLLVVAVGCLAYGFLFQKSDPSYAIKMTEARRLLLGVCLPPGVFGSNPPDCEARSLGGDKVGWIAKLGGGEIFATSRRCPMRAMTIRGSGWNWSERRRALAETLRKASRRSR